MQPRISASPKSIVSQVFLTVLLIGSSQAQVAAYDPNEFPGRGSAMIFDKANSYVREGDGLFDQRKFRPALSRYSSAIELYPYSANSYYKSGLASFELKDYTTALLQFKRTVALAPDFPDGYSHKGETQFKLKDLKGSEESCRAALDLDPYSTLALICLAEVCLDTSRVESAQNYLGTANSLPGAEEYRKRISKNIARANKLLAEK